MLKREMENLLWKINYKDLQWAKTSTIDSSSDDIDENEVSFLCSFYWVIVIVWMTQQVNRLSDSNDRITHSPRCLAEAITCCFKTIHLVCEWYFFYVFFFLFKKLCLHWATVIGFAVFGFPAIFSLYFFCILLFWCILYIHLITITLS